MASKQMKRRIFSGAVCEQIAYSVSSKIKDTSTYDPEKKRVRLKSEEERRKHKTEISRRKHNRKFMENFCPGDIYSTLTFNNEWEVHTFQEAKKVRKAFVRSLKRICPDAVIFLYMGRGKSTSRIHFHMVSHGLPKEVIYEKWKYGSVIHDRELRKHNWYNGVDHGADFTGLANYLFDHWTEEVGGHRWFQTKNAREPDAEEPTEVRITGGYSEKRPPVAPKGYKLVETKSNKYGYLYFKYVLIPPKDPHRSAAKKTGPRTG